jgi:hypothetical protein
VFVGVIVGVTVFVGVFVGVTVFVGVLVGDNPGVCVTVGVIVFVGVTVGVTGVSIKQRTEKPHSHKAKLCAKVVLL